MGSTAGIDNEVFVTQSVGLFDCKYTINNVGSVVFRNAVYRFKFSLRLEFRHCNLYLSRCYFSYK